MLYKAGACVIMLWVASLTFAEESVDYPLRSAVLAGDVDAISVWLESDARSLPNYRSEVKDSFFLSVRNQKADVVQVMLIHGVDPNQTDSNTGETALYIAAQTGNEHIIGILLKNGANPLHDLDKDEAHLGRLLHESISNGNNRFVELCLDAGLQPDYPFYSLHGDSLLNESIKQGNAVTFQLLIERGASITVVSMQNNYKSSLALAIEYRGLNSVYVKSLRQKGAFEARYVHPEPNVAESRVEGLRVRKRPSLDAEVLGVLAKGAQVMLLEVTPLSYSIDGLLSPWIKVRCGNVQGWAYGGYLWASPERYGQSP